VPRPTEHHRQLGAALAEARREAKVLQKDAADLLGCSQPSIARVETGTRALHPEDLRRLLDFYTPSRKLRERIESLTRLAAGSAGQGLNPKFDDMVSASEAAEAIYTFHSERIPMTLQCERYALKQYLMYDPAIQPVTVLRLLDRRTRVFTLPRPPEYHAIMTVSSLLRMPGGQLDLVKEQARHLLHLLDVTPSLTLRVLGLVAPIPFVDSDFTLLVMPNRRDNTVYVPFGLDGHTIKDKAKIDERAAYWHQAQQAALTEDETRDLLRSLAERGMETAITTRRGA
jgi:transcriptional regulator with XRE-family HTH domain